MKKLLLLILLFATVSSCSRNDKYYPSAIEGLIGQWELQSRVLNDVTPVETDTEIINFSEDNDIRDLNGLFIIETNEVTSGAFSISSENPIMTFTDSNNNSTSYDFSISTITLSLGRINENGDAVKEVWIKTYN